MKYIQYTRHLPLIICADGKGIGILIDVSQAIHADMRGHVITYASMTKRAIISSVNRIKLNTPSSIETDIVAVRREVNKIHLVSIIQRSTNRIY